VSGSPSTWGSWNEPPSGDLLSKFVSTLDSVDIIASNGMGEAGWARVRIRAGWIQRRPAYRRAEEQRVEVKRRLGEQGGGAGSGRQLRTTMGWELFSKLGNRDRHRAVFPWDEAHDGANTKWDG